MPNITINIPGKPKPKQRPRMVRGKIWTPSTVDEEYVAAHMLKHKGKFAGCKELALTAWFFGAHHSADGDNLWKLVCDAAVRAGVIDDDRYVIYGSFEKRRVAEEGNPFPEEPSTRLTIGHWK